MMATVDSNNRPDFDREITDIADYVLKYQITNELAYETAYYSFLDSIGCALLALQYPACTKLLGPIIEGTVVPKGVRVPGTTFELDPVQAAFNIGTLIRWLDFNDTWLAAEWGHPSDNLGGILAVMDYLSLRGANFTVRDVLTAMIKAHEIQGILALENSFNRVGLDHVVLVKVASTAVITQLLGGTREQLVSAISHAWIDGQSLRTYRQAPNTGSRKSWAAGDATSRAVRIAMLVMQGEKGYPSALTAKNWGFYDAQFEGEHFKLPRPYTSYVMENILFKIAFPAEFHAQTAVEAAIHLHPIIKDKLAQIDKIELTTQESAVRIISKQGPLYNPADRDHCLQYMVAIGLLFGELDAKYYEDDNANDPRIDQLRNKMFVLEDKQYSIDYHDPEKRAITNAIQVYFKDGTSTDKIIIEYPLGHKKRRKEGIPLLIEKFRHNITKAYLSHQTQQVEEVFLDKTALINLPVEQLMSLLAVK